MAAGGAAPAKRPATLATRGPVLELAADGGRVALVVGRPHRCARVVVWTPGGPTVTLQTSLRCEQGDHSPREGTHGVALAGTRAAWVRTAGGNTLETMVMTATVAAPRLLLVGFGAAGPGQSGTFAEHPLGDRDLLVFATYRRCEETEPGGSPSVFHCRSGFTSGEIASARLWRVQPSRPACPVPGRPAPSLCVEIRSTAEEQTPLAAGGGLIAVRRRSGTVEVIRANGSHVARFRYGRGLVQAAALNGHDLVVQHGRSLDVFDLSTSTKSATLPLVGVTPRLRDLDAGLVVYTSGGRVRVLRLRDRKDVGLGSAVDAEIESPGLFYAARNRVTFMPAAIVRAKLG